MNGPDSATSSEPVEPSGFDGAGALDDALDDFAPEGASGPPRPANASVGSFRAALSAADQFVRDIRSRKPQAAPAPKPPSVLATRLADIARQSVRVALVVGAVAAVLLGLAFVGFRVAELTKAPRSVGAVEDPQGDAAVADGAARGRSGSTQRRRGTRVSPTAAGPGQPRQAGAPAPSGGRLLAPGDYARAPASPAATRNLAAQPASASAAAPQRFGDESDSTAAAAQRSVAGQAEIDHNAVYSSEDEDVLPPQMRSPEQPHPLISGVPTRTESIEVIVSARGTVERVRYVTAPRRMPDMMILSRAKVWEFSPALKDGRPVRYRLILSWETSQ